MDLAASGKRMKKITQRMGVFLVLAILVLVSACRDKTDGSDCSYAPWTIEEYELFGLSKEPIVSKWPVKFSEDGRSIMFKPSSAQRYNLEFDKAEKVCAVQRYFVGCSHTYHGPWLVSQTDALNYCISGLTNFQDPQSKAKLTVAKGMLAKLTPSR